MALFWPAALCAAAPWMQTALRVAGRLYLTWLARHAGRVAPEPVTPESAGDFAALRGGLLAQVANPKGSAFVTMLPAHASATTGAAILGTVNAVEALWFSLLALAFSAGRVRRGCACVRGGVDRAPGGLMGLIGARLALG